MLKLGVTGLSSGNGHPYSWAAIINGYDKSEMAKCPFPVILEYLFKNDPDSMGIPDAAVTHVWTQDAEISNAVARSSLIPNVVDDMEDMIGEVDAVLFARDDGENHLEMTRPFIEAGVPILIDKPLTDQADHIAPFVRYYEQGKQIMSCSSARYAPGLMELKKNNPVGRILTASGVTPKYWRTYGIHMIESICTVMGVGIESVQNVGRPQEEIVHLQYADGRHAVVQSFARIKGGQVTFFGENGAASPRKGDGYHQFKNMLLKFIEMLKTGQSPIDWHETVEMARIVIAGQMSMDQGGRVVRLDEIE